MNYIRELCLRERAARERVELYQFQIERRQILKASDPGWKLYWEIIKQYSPLYLIDACPREHFHNFRDLVIAVTPNPAVQEMVVPESVFDWKWMRRELMCLHFATMPEIANRLGRPESTVRDAIRGLGGNPEYACSGVANRHVQFWSKRWLTDTRLVSRLSGSNSRRR